DVRSEKVKATVEADIQEAHELGFSGTPAFLLNGIPIKGAYPIEHFESIIKRLP
ncbi:MAG: thioredoxin domain-containing protein, partial [Deltaproteobacteria bacterium]|nr:thioredoxin domain-containing protein [Deltaproteobacteria bacterium]